MHQRNKTALLVMGVLVMLAARVPLTRLAAQEPAAVREPDPLDAELLKELNNDLLEGVDVEAPSGDGPSKGDQPSRKAKENQPPGGEDLGEESDEHPLCLG